MGNKNLDRGLPPDDPQRFVSQTSREFACDRLGLIFVDIKEWIVLSWIDLPNSGFKVLFDLIPDRTRPKIAVVMLTRLHHPVLHEMALHNGARRHA